MNEKAMAIAGTRITILADNTVTSHDLRGEHGIAVCVDTGDRRLLFDTGQGLVLTDNARALRVELGAVDTVVLSHGHYDHTGGLADVLQQARSPIAVQAHPDALSPKFRRDGAGVRNIGMPAVCQAAIHGPHCQLRLSRQAMEVAPGVWVTGEIPRRHPEEAIDEPFCRDPEGREADALLDDQALFFDTPQGTVVLLGCAHAGVINTLDHVQGLTAGNPICAVIGGLHLRSAAAARVAWTIQALHRFGIQLLAPMHCTGQKASGALWTAFPQACQPCGAGTLFEFHNTRRQP